jgi:hypothetical protein
MRARRKNTMVSGAAALLTIGALAAGALGLGAPAAWATVSSAPVEGTPALDHVFTIVLENESLATTWNTPGTYLHSLLSKGVFASQYYGTSHLSADNYMAMTSGQSPTPVFNADCMDWWQCYAVEQSRPDGGVNVTDQVEAAHKTWRAYMDGMGFYKDSTGNTAACLHPAADSSPAGYSSDPYQEAYATRHDPFVYYPTIVGNNDPSYCANHVVDYSKLAGDLATENGTPNYAFITPDTCHDGHDSPCASFDIGQPDWRKGGLYSANDWMSTEVPKILSSPAFTTPGVASVLFITTDEAANTDATGCTTGPPTNGGTSPGTPGTCASGIAAAGVDGGGLVGLLAIGSPAAHVGTPGTTTATPYDHASLLRTVEDGLGLGPLTPSSATTVISQDAAGHLNNAGSPLEHSMASLFVAP